MTAHPDAETSVQKAGTGLSRRFAAPRAILALILREMSARYGKNPGGYIWAILEPLGVIIVLSVGFSIVQRSPSLGTNFLLFYATGFIPFNLFQSLQKVVSRAIVYSRPLLKYPVVTWVDAILARFILNTVTGLLVAYILLSGIIFYADLNVILTIDAIAWSFFLAMLLGLGVGALNCAIIGLFPTWEIIWSVATRPLFIISGIFFMYEDMPPAVQAVLWYNPLLHVTGLMRVGFYPTYAPNYVSILYVLTLSLIVLVMGLVLIGRYYQDFLNR